MTVTSGQRVTTQSLRQLRLVRERSAPTASLGRLSATRLPPVPEPVQGTSRTDICTWRMCVSSGCWRDNLKSRKPTRAHPTEDPIAYGSMQLTLQSHAQRSRDSLTGVAVPSRTLHMGLVPLRVVAVTADMAATGAADADAADSRRVRPMPRPHSGSTGERTSERWTRPQ